MKWPRTFPPDDEPDEWDDFDEVRGQPQLGVRKFWWGVTPDYDMCRLGRIGHCKPCCAASAPRLTPPLCGCVPWCRGVCTRVRRYPSPSHRLPSQDASTFEINVPQPIMVYTDHSEVRLPPAAAN